VILDEAVEEEIIEANVAIARKVKKKKTGKLSAAERPGKIRQFSGDELVRILKAAATSHTEYFPLFLLLGRTGMRPGEAPALRWNDLDFRNCKILVAPTLSAGVVGSTKTETVRPEPFGTKSWHQTPRPPKTSPSP
jgi:integrase